MRWRGLMYKPISLFSCCSIFLFLFQAVAEELPEIVVTATRTDRNVELNLAPVTILKQDNFTHATLPEELRNVPGVDLNSSGGFGKFTNLNLRGTNSNQVLLLIDGIPVGSATAGTPAWEYLPLAQTQRIEIVRGPRSSLYGSAAIGGIVQMFTPRGKGAAHAEVTAATGSLNTHELSANFSGAQNNNHYYLGGSYLATNGINAGNPFSPDEPDADGYHNSSFALSFGHRADRAEFDFHVLRATGQSEFDGTPDENFLQQIMGLNLALSPSNFWKTSLTVGQANDERDSDSAPFLNYYHTQRRYQSWQNDVIFTADQILTLGLDQQSDEINSSNNYTVTKRDNRGVFIQHQANLGRHELIGGVRYDENDSFGGHTTGNITYGLSLTPKLRLIIGWGSAFRAPTFNDLYWPLAFGYQGNPNLNPEQARSYETGLLGKSHWGNWQLRAFRTNIYDLITYDGSTNPATVINLARAQIDGLESQFDTHFNHNWNLSTSLTILDPRDRDTQHILPRRARHTAQLNLSHQVDKLRATFNLLNQGGRYDDITNTTYLDSYTIMGVRFDYHLAKSWQLFGYIDNLFDKNYQTVAGFNSVGRTIMFGINYTAARRNK